MKIVRGLRELANNLKNEGVHPQMFGGMLAIMTGSQVYGNPHKGTGYVS